MCQHILLIEDDEAVRHNLVEFLERCGSRVTACRGEAAAERALARIADPAEGPDILVASPSFMAFSVRARLRFPNLRWIPTRIEMSDIVACNDHARCLTARQPADRAHAGTDSGADAAAGTSSGDDRASLELRRLRDPNGFYRNGQHIGSGDGASFSPDGRTVTFEIVNFTQPLEPNASLEFRDLRLDRGNAPMPANGKANLLFAAAGMSFRILGHR